MRPPFRNHFPILPFAILLLSNGEPTPPYFPLYFLSKKARAHILMYLFFNGARQTTKNIERKKKEKTCVWKTSKGATYPKDILGPDGF